MLSRCVGLVTPDPEVAANYYQTHFGMTQVQSEAGVELCAGPLRLFLDPGQPKPMVLEVITPDLREARPIVRRLGYEEIVWRGPGQSCLVRDPFGLVFNIHEDRSAFLLLDIDGSQTGFLKSCLGAIVSSPVDVAGFYAEVLESTADRLPDGTYLVESGPLRLRFKQGILTTPVVWMRSDAPIDKLMAAGCHGSEPSVLTDPFGLSWCAESLRQTERAVVCL